jgi:hypothetical protein
MTDLEVAIAAAESGASIVRGASARPSIDSTRVFMIA